MQYLMYLHAKQKIIYSIVVVFVGILNKAVDGGPAVSTLDAYTATSACESFL